MKQNLRKKLMYKSFLPDGKHQKKWTISLLVIYSKTFAEKERVINGSVVCRSENDKIKNQDFLKSNRHFKRRINDDIKSSSHQLLLQFQKHGTQSGCCCHQRLETKVLCSSRF